MKVYCPDCGTKIEYKAAKKPNFCTNCGYKFAGAKVDPHRWSGSPWIKYLFLTLF